MRFLSMLYSSFTMHFLTDPVYRVQSTNREATVKKTISLHSTMKMSILDKSLDSHA